MRKGFFSLQKVNKGIKLKRLFIIMSGLLAFSAPAMAANSLPSFVNGYSQAFNLCENAAATPVNSLLAINDLDFGQTETWTVLAGPLHGTLGGFSATATSIGGVLTPTGLSYMPMSGYVGNDTFTIEIFDGFDTSTTNVVVTVKAIPTLSSSLTPPAICDGTLFSYTPKSTTTGATFTWSRAFVGGITNPAATGTDNPNETLANSTYYSIPVTYAYTIVANGCTNHENVTVAVLPTPRLSSPLADTVCSGAVFTYTPTTLTTGATYSWSRAAVPGISPASSSGTGNISEALTNNTLAPLDAVYTFVLNAGGCTSTRNVSVMVSPQPAITTITTRPGTSVCSGAFAQNFGAGIAPPAGISFAWSAVNASIMATGTTKQYCLVNFPTAGTAVITLTFTVAGTGCISRDTLAVSVGTAAAVQGSVLYYNSQFIYLDNDVDSYQWGFDDKATLDSTLIPGATFQSYLTTTAPDLNNKYYWVITKKKGCLQKTYLNAPLAITNLQAQQAEALHVYPNPADNTVSVDVSGAADNAAIAITNMIGQVVRSNETIKHTEFDIAGLPPGCYFVICTRNGVKTAVSKFVKN
jgi:hypothetical protein